MSDLHWPIRFSSSDSPLYERYTKWRTMNDKFPLPYVELRADGMVSDSIYRCYSICDENKTSHGDVTLGYHVSPDEPDELEGEIHFIQNEMQGLGRIRCLGRSAFICSLDLLACMGVNPVISAVTESGLRIVEQLRQADVVTVKNEFYKGTEDYLSGQAIVNSRT